MDENSFKDIHNLLVDQIKKLSDDSLCKNMDKLKIQTERAKAMCGLVGQINSLANTQIHALEVKGEYGFCYNEMPEQLDMGTR